MSGSAPYRGTSDYEIVTSHFEEPIPQLAGEAPVVVETNRILRTAMAKQPGDRYPSAAALLDDVRRAQSAAAATDPEAAAGTPAPGDSGRRRRRAGLVAGLAVVFVAGTAVAAFALRGDGEESGDPGPGPTSSDTGSTTPPTSPSTPGSTFTAASGDEAKAVASLSRAFVAQGLMTQAQADCAAQQWVEAAGVQTMIDEGFFDESMEFYDQDQSQMSPEMRSAALSATLACVSATP